MKRRKFKAEYNGLNFEIEESIPEIGVYLYVWKDSKNIADYLQNTIDICKKFALRKYGVALDSWVEAEPIDIEIG